MLGHKRIGRNTGRKKGLIIAVIIVSAQIMTAANPGPVVFATEGEQSPATIAGAGTEVLPEETETESIQKETTEELPKEDKESPDTGEETANPSAEESETPAADDELPETESRDESEPQEGSGRAESEPPEEESGSADSDVEATEGFTEEETDETETDNGVTEKYETEVTASIYAPDIVNVAVPSMYAVALNPYCFTVRTGDHTVSDDQVISKKYGIINKSSTDKIVTVMLTVEDLNSVITFVDSADAAMGADENVYAVYLALAPADKSGVKIGTSEADQDTTAEALSDVGMTAATDKAVTLYAGENRVAFKLSKAMYGVKDENLMSNVPDQGDGEALPVLTGLAPDGAGVTAFTFVGAMNKKADWSSLSKGIRISVAYSYETPDGSETIVDGTGALVHLD